jgi:subtilisin family serine protease
VPKSPIVRLAALALAAILALPAAAAASPSQRPASPTAGERPTFIVTLRPGTDAAATAAEWRGRGVEVSHVYRNAISGFAGRMGPETAEQVRRDGRVTGIERDSIVRHTGTQGSAPWGLDRIDQRLRPLDGSYTYDSTASGIPVYVIDTGVRATHTDFGGRIGAGYTAIADGRGTDDCHGHGTHVAGTVAGSTWGVAKAATIHPVRVLACDGSGTVSGIVAALDWIIARHASGTPAVANMSLGGGASSTLDNAVGNTVADGVTVVVAAGNDGGDACTKSPARVAAALTVASSTSSDARSSFSNWGSCVDLFAPGSSIKSAYHSSDTATATMSGTSMAAPHVAGVAALYLAGTPSATPATVHAAVNDGATSGVITDTSGSPNRLAFSRLVPVEAPSPPAATAPDAPATPKASAAKRAIKVAWTAPSDGGSTITGYTVRAHRTDGTVAKTVTVSGTTTSTNVTGLSGGVSYYATVAATNAIGTSAWSPASNTVTARR